MSLLSFIAALGVALSDAPAPDCPALAGVDLVLHRENLTHIVVGEAHGTRELPQLFGDLICNLARSGRSLTVGLEFTPENQTAIDAYLASDGGPSAVSRLLQSPGWSDQAGRASVAILDLLERLRRLRQTGLDLTVVAFDHPSETSAGTSALREAGMARLLIEAHAHRPASVVVALTGVGHAGRGPWTSFDPPFPSMSQHLDSSSTLTVTFVRSGGEVWGCRRPAEQNPQVCRVWPYEAREAVRTRGIWFDGERPGFDAVISTGGVYSGSPPARVAQTD